MRYLRHFAEASNHYVLRAGGVLAPLYLLIVVAESAAARGGWLGMLQFWSAAVLFFAAMAWQVGLWRGLGSMASRDAKDAKEKEGHGVCD